MAEKITMTKTNGEVGLLSISDSGIVGSKIGGTIGLVKSDSGALSYSSDGKQWTPISGGGSGGGGAFDLVKIVSYKAPFETITEITLSGMTDHEDMGGTPIPLSSANGTYQILPEYEGNAEVYPVYKNTASDYYLTTADEMSGNSPAHKDDENVYWCIASSAATDPYSAYLTKFGNTLSEGTEKWDNMMEGYSDNITVAISAGSPEEVKIKKASAYNSSLDSYTFESSEETASSSQFVPKAHGVYAKSGSHVFGDPIGSEYGNFCRAYIEGTVLPKKDNQAYVTVLTPEWGEYMVGAWDANFQLVQKAGIDVTELTGSSGIGEKDLAEYPHTYYGDFTDLTLSAAFWGGDEGISNKFTSVLGFGRYSGNGICIAINWYNPITVLGVIGKALSTDYCYKFENSSIVNSWHHAALTYSGKKKLATLYIDGVARGTFSGDPNYGGYKWLYFGGNGGGDELGGCRREMKLFNVELTAAQVLAEFERCKAICNIQPIA